MNVSRRPRLWQVVPVWCAAVMILLPSAVVRGADPLVDAAVDAVAQLTDPARLILLLDDAAVQARLGPALGWLHVARRHDVQPESVIARALARNGLTGVRAAATRESLLRNLARADAWELFNHPESARALAYGRAPIIPGGMHRGRLAGVNFAVSSGGILQEAARPADGWDFGSLSLRADDEPPPRPLPGGGSRRRGGQGGNKVPSTVRKSIAPGRTGTPVRKKEVPRLPPPPIIYDDPLPTADP